MKQKPLIFTLAALAAAGSSVIGQNWIPANTGTQDWNVTTNWTGGTIPDTSGETPYFGSNLGGGNLNRLNNSTTYTVNQNVANLTLGSMQILLNGSGSGFSSGGVSGTNTVTVGAGSNFRVGDSITGTGLANGTKVTGVSGNILTLSNNFSAQASGNYTPSNYGTNLNITGNPITFGNSGNMYFQLRKGNAASNNLVDISSNIVFATGTTYLSGEITQGTTATIDGVNITGTFSGAGAVRGNATINNSANSQSGIWTLDGNNYIKIASNSMGTAQYRVSPGLSNCILTFSDTGNFSVTNKVGDTGDTWGGSLTGGQQTTGLNLTNTLNTVATFSDFEIGKTAGNGYATLGKGGGSLAATYKISDSDWSPNANLRMDSTNLDFANASGVQILGGSLVFTGGGEGFTRSEAGGTTILTQSTTMSANATISGGTLLVNNPTSNVTTLTVNVSSGNRSITTTSTAGLVLGQSISGTGIAGGAFVTEITNGTQFVISSLPTATTTGVNATFTANSGTGSGNVNVTGGTLGGSGLIAPGGTNKITVSSGAKISPGGNASGHTINKLVINGANTSAIGLLTLQSGAGLEFGLNGTAVTGDQIQLINGAAGDISFVNNLITLSLTGILSSGQTYTLFDGTADDQYTGLTLDGGNRITAGLSFTGLSEAFQTDSYLTRTNGDIILNVVPESHAALLGGLGMLALLRRRRTAQ